MGLKVCVCGGEGGEAQTYHFLPIKKWGHMPSCPPPPPPASYASDIHGADMTGKTNMLWESFHKMSERMN